MDYVICNKDNRIDHDVIFHSKEAAQSYIDDIGDDSLTIVPISLTIPEGWKVSRLWGSSIGFIIGSPRDENGISDNTSVWLDDDDPAHRLLAQMLENARHER